MPSQAGKCCRTVTDATSSETHGKPRVSAGGGRDRCGIRPLWVPSLNRLGYHSTHFDLTSKFSVNPRPLLLLLQLKERRGAPPPHRVP